MEPQNHADLEEEIEQLREDLFLAQTDLKNARLENVSLKNFIQTLYESCEGLEETDLTLAELLSNLKENIRRFSKDNGVRI
ncbi:MAG: hypothetical protein AAF616_05105 [Bacteroidota bacterium]